MIPLELTPLVFTAVALLIVGTVVVWSWRRSRLDHSDLSAGGTETLTYYPATATSSSFTFRWTWEADNRRAEIALRVRDRLGPAGDDEHEYAAVLAEVESLVVA